MSAHYFVADAHLGAGRPDGEERLLRFLSTIKGRAESLYILGDLFDFWFDYRTVMPKFGFAVLTRLAELEQAGTELHFVRGNHDFRFRGLPDHMPGISVVGDEMEAVVDGRRVFLCHGDALDRGFVPRLFRALMRNPVSNALYSLLHPDVGFWLAHWVADRSRDIGAKSYLLEDMARFAQEKLAAGFDVVVMAHSHVPELRRFDRGEYLNVGDWVKDSSYGLMRDGVLSLERFEGAGP